MKILDDDVISASRECFCSCGREEKELFIIQFGFMRQINSGRCEGCEACAICHFSWRPWACVVNYHLPHMCFTEMLSITAQGSINHDTIYTQSLLQRCLSSLVLTKMTRKTAHISALSRMAPSDLTFVKAHWKVCNKNT